MITSKIVGPNFTGRLLTWWIAVAALNECFVHLTNLWVEYIARDLDDRTGIATLFVLVIMNAILIPVIATTQWQVLRRGWMGICWGEWLAVSAVTAFSTGVVWWWLPLSRIGLPLKFLIAVIGSGIAAAVTTVLLSNKQTKTSVSILLFMCFLVGGTTATLLQVFDLTALRTYLFFPAWHLWETLRDIVAARPFKSFPWLLPLPLSVVGLLVAIVDVAAAAVGAAISGFGLWMASQPEPREVQHNVV